eukprot:9216849-Pyramimonas_sp.AAC.1
MGAVTGRGASSSSQVGSSGCLSAPGYVPKKMKLLKPFFGRSRSPRLPLDEARSLWSFVSRLLPHLEHGPLLVGRGRPLLLEL